MPIFNVRKPTTPQMAWDEYYRGATVPMRDLHQAGILYAHGQIGNMSSAGRLARVLRNGIMDYHLLLKE